MQYKLLYHHQNDTCVIIHQYWLFSNNHNCSKTENNNTTTKYYIPRYIKWQCYRFICTCCLFTMRFQRNKILQVYTNKYNINILLLKHWKNNVRHKLYLSSNFIILMPTEEFINYQSVLVLVFLYQSHEGTAGSVHTTNQALCCHEVNISTKQVLLLLHILAGFAALFAA